MIRKKDVISYLDYRGAIDLPATMTFGFEIEGFIRTEKIAPLTPFLSRVDPKGGWADTGDASLWSSKEWHMGCEVVSPVLSGKEGLERAFTVFNFLWDYGLRPNDHCGFHVHIGFTDESWNNPESKFKALKNIYTAYLNSIDTLESVYMAPQRIDDPYCLRPRGKEKDPDHFVALEDFHKMDRCRYLNMATKSTRYQTIEWRLRQGEGFRRSFRNFVLPILRFTAEARNNPGAKLPIKTVRFTKKPSILQC